MTQTPPKPSITDLVSLCDGLAACLAQHIEDRDRALNEHDRPGAAKRIATITLAMELRSGLRRDLALSLAAKAVASQLSITPGGLKRSASEARAVLAYGLSPAWRKSLAQSDQMSDIDLVSAIDEMIRLVNISAAVSARAGALSGAKGGRPRRPPESRFWTTGAEDQAGLTPDGVMELVQQLIRLGAQGDSHARSRLMAIDEQIRGWLYLEVNRFTPRRGGSTVRSFAHRQGGMERAAE